MGNMRDAIEKNEVLKWLLLLSTLLVFWTVMTYVHNNISNCTKVTN